MKHAGQLTSKARFLAAPWIGMLEAGAWTTRAAHANAMAQRLAALNPSRSPIRWKPTRSSWRWTSRRCSALNAAGWHVYRFIDGSVRFMCSWATTPEAVDEFGAVLNGLV